MLDREKLRAEFRAYLRQSEVNEGTDELKIFKKILLKN